MTDKSSIDTTQPYQLVLFRDDLRTVDHPALLAASEAGPVVALYILDEQSPGIRPLGAAARWWPHHALVSLRASLQELGIPLVLRRGNSVHIIEEITGHGACAAVHWNRRYGQAERAVDTLIKDHVRAAGLHAQSHAGALLHEPWELLTQSGTGYKVFTPFHNAPRSTGIREPHPAPQPQSPPHVELPGSRDAGQLGAAAQFARLVHRAGGCLDSGRTRRPGTPGRGARRYRAALRRAP
ncbi:deoxyribodipyrimidine photo-lyase [Glutamicibacter halophytocola]|uniref:deoxyribodipyrimidine photo-lyase n=1 Tax=Glutamicibacter halophytocola TaxID=1933880 RepID=UPI00321A5DAA